MGLLLPELGVPVNPLYDQGVNDHRVSSKINKIIIEFLKIFQQELQRIRRDEMILPFSKC